MLQQMGLLMLLAATISAAASSKAEIRIQGNSTNVKIEMNFDTPTTIQSLQAVISQLSNGVFQIVVDDEHQACQLARIINSDLSPCFHEQRKETEPEDTDAVVFYRNGTSKKRKTARNALWSAKGTHSISVLHPPLVLLQASQDSPDYHPYMVSETRNNAPKDLPVTTVPPTKPPPGTHSRTAPNAAVGSADHPDVLPQANRESSERDQGLEHDQTLNGFNTSNITQNNLPTTAVPPTKLVPDSHSHTLATAPFIPAAHPDVLLQASQDFAGHPLQQDLHGTPRILHFISCQLSHHTIYVGLTVLTLYSQCTHDVLHSQCTVLQALTHHVLFFLCMYCTQYTLHSLTHSLAHSLTH
jgi:hypothetical protein